MCPVKRKQVKYEALLRDLTQKAFMVGMQEKVDPELMTAYRQAEDELSDRKTELDFIEGEIESLLGDARGRMEALRAEIEELKGQESSGKKTFGVKKGKLDPLKKQLAGSEYDLKFAERAMEEELRKKKKAEQTEDFDKARKHEDVIKHLKIDILKRKKGLDELRRKIAEIEQPAQNIRGSIGEIDERIGELEEELVRLSRSRDEVTLNDLKSQRSQKKEEILVSEQRLRQALIGIGEDLYERRFDHPVLKKYYADIDKLEESLD